MLTARFRQLGSAIAGFLARMSSRGTRCASRPRNRVAAMAAAATCICAMALSAGCQVLAGPTPPPVPTAILLAQTPSSEPAALDVASPGPATPAPTSTPTAQRAPSNPAQLAVTPTAEAFLPVRLIAVGVRATVPLRVAPGADAPVAAQVQGSEAFWVEGRDADGRWLWVSAGPDRVRGWVAAADLKVFGDSSRLALVTPAAEAVTPQASATSRPGGSAGRTSQASGKVVFQLASGGDIYLVGADGSGLRRLTDGMDPALSPDGGRVAFTRWGAPPGVFILDLASGQERRVTSANRPRSPSWSPDGDQLVFVHLVRTVLCRASPFGCLSDDELRARFGGADCLVTPRGRICIADLPQRQLEQTGIARVSTEGADWLDLPATTDAQSVSWRPQRNEVLFRGGGRLQLTSDGSGPRSLVQNAAIGSPAWSPDGSRIAVQMQLHDNTEVFVLDASGQTLARVAAPRLDTGRAANNVAPAWSPDGKTLLFLSDRSGSWRLYRANADGSGQALFLPEALRDLSFTYDYAAERVASWGR